MCTIDFFVQVKEQVSHIFYVFLNESGAALFIGSASLLASIIALRCLIGGLLEMHKSNSTMKKLRKQYGFWQKLFLIMAWRENEHATSFCKGLIVFHHVRLGIFLISLLLTGLASILPELSTFATSIWVALSLVVDIPILLFSCAMDRYPFRRIGRKKRPLREYRFEKYHNTKDHDSLF